MPRGRPKKVEETKIQLTKTEWQAVIKLVVAAHKINTSFMSVEHPRYNEVVEFSEALDICFLTLKDLKDD